MMIAFGGAAITPRYGAYRQNNYPVTFGERGVPSKRTEPIEVEKVIEPVAPVVVEPPPAEVKPGGPGAQDPAPRGGTGDRNDPLPESNTTV